MTTDLQAHAPRFDNASVLVTGGTGSFGKKFIETIFDHFNPRRVVVYSRDELKQYEMSKDPRFSGDRAQRMRYFIGDVRDQQRVMTAMEDVDIVVHAAALKHVPVAEYNPFEAIKTNVLGAQHVIDACMKQGVKRVVALSTDKAAAPINLYGATKLCSDKLFVAANNYRGKRDVRFSVVRYGNVMGSRGSVIPFFIRERAKGVLPITHPEMTRFNITLEEGVAMVIRALDVAWGGELFVPKIPSYRITELARAIAPQCEQKIIGIRPGEKLHEEMITATDSLRAAAFEDYYVIFPSMPLFWTIEDYLEHFSGEPCPMGFHYTSGNNSEWLSIEQLRRLIQQHVDPSFTPS